MVALALPVTVFAVEPTLALLPSAALPLSSANLAPGALVLSPAVWTILCLYLVAVYPVMVLARFVWPGLQAAPEALRLAA